MPPSAPLTFETELKLTLASAADYERLRAALPAPIRTLSQENLFLDTQDGSLAIWRWALRLRLERREQPPVERVLLALKGPSKSLEGATHRVDIEAEVDPALWRRISMDRCIPLEDLQGPAAMKAQTLLPSESLLLVRLRFFNRRVAYPLDLGGAPRELLLDQTCFATGEVDHEIELELPLSQADPDAQKDLIAVRDELNALLRASGVRATPSSMGKLSRALAYAARRA